jgi:hypothetical protein
LPNFAKRKQTKIMGSFIDMLTMTKRNADGNREPWAAFWVVIPVFILSPFLVFQLAKEPWLNKMVSGIVMFVMLCILWSGIAFFSWAVANNRIRHFGKKQLAQPQAAPTVETSISGTKKVEQKTTIGNLTPEQTNELWKLCNDNIFKKCTESDFISSFQPENNFLLGYKNGKKLSMYDLCSFLTISTMYEPEDGETMLDKILTHFGVDKKEVYAKSYIREIDNDDQSSKKRRKLYTSIKDFFDKNELLVV